MDLSLREAASILGIPVRTLRARVARGVIRATRDGRQWRIRRQDLPMTDAQRQVLQSRAEEVRQAVDGILPSRAATTGDRKSRSLADLDAFREAAGVIGALRTLPADRGRDEAVAALEAACAFLGEASYVYERDRKLRALSDARAAIGRAVAVLYVHHGIPAADPVAALVARIEGTVVPAVGGYARWVAQLGAAR